MKRSLKFLSMALLVSGMVFMSACSDDDGGGGSKTIPPALVKTLTIDETTWEFTYDEANNDRLVSVLVTEGDDDPYTITYDYSVAGRVTETEAGLYNSYFVLDSEGRIIKSLWDESEADDNFDGYAYDEDGYLVRIYYKEDGVEHTLQTATVVSDNITVHTQFDGTDVERTKTFTYLPNATALNVSNLPQANLRNSERRTIGGLYGKASKKLVDFLELDYTGAPDDYVKNKNTYTFDAKNRVTSITRTGVDVNGDPTDLNETFFYTYYEDEE